jgi:hypothetical protein
MEAHDNEKIDLAGYSNGWRFVLLHLLAGWDGMHIVHTRGLRRPGLDDCSRRR